MPCRLNELIDLIERSPETECFDVKADYYAPDKKADMLHDILCMANSPGEEERLIVCGITDDRNVCGISSRFFENNFWTDIRSFPTNYQLPVEVELVELDEFDGHKMIALIKISASPFRPFFLTKDYTKGGKTVRAGVVYGRSQSNNTPINSSLSDAEIAKLWEMRFGLHLQPAERVIELVQQVDSWINTTHPDSDNVSLYYHESFPEYTLEMSLSSQSERGGFWEPWMERITDSEYKRRAGETSTWNYHLRYHGTRLRTGRLMHVRHTIMPLPTIVSNREQDKPAKDMEYQIEIDTLDYFVSAICVAERWDPDRPSPDRLSQFDYRIFEDTNVMIPPGTFHLQRRGL